MNEPRFSGVARHMGKVAFSATLSLGLVLFGTGTYAYASPAIQEEGIPEISLPSDREEEHHQQPPERPHVPFQDPPKQEFSEQEPPKQDPPKQEFSEQEPPKQDPPKQESSKQESPKQDPPKQESSAVKSEQQDEKNEKSVVAASDNDGDKGKEESANKQETNVVQGEKMEKTGSETQPLLLMGLGLLMIGASLTIRYRMVMI